ncbi:hypothetical protein [Desulfobacter sp.]
MSHATANKVKALIDQGENQLFQHAGMFHYDLTGVEKTSLKNLNMAAISSYFQRYDIDIDDEQDVTSLLINTDVLTDKKNVTVAGLLLFGTHPQKFLKNSSISYAHFAGTELSDELQETGEEFQVILPL